METKTIKLVGHNFWDGHNFQAGFFLQINGADTERLIAEGKEKGYWRRIYYFYSSSSNLWIWKTEPALRKYLMSYPSLMNNTRREPDGNGEYLMWVEKVVQGSTGMFTKDEPVFAQGTVQDIVT